MIRSKKSLLAFAFIFGLVGCNQQEFYEKEYLEGLGVPDEIPVDEERIPVDEPTNNPANPNNGGGTNGGGTSGGGTNGGGTTTPPPQGVCGAGTLANTKDQFVQNSSQTGKVDILWVVDNSGSMGDEQNALARNFDTFIQEFIQKNIDFKMAITTTDPYTGNDGRIIGNPNALTSQAAANDQSSFMSDFRSMIRVGTNGAGSERGLRTSRNALRNHLTNWVREDAFLVIVYVSDEEDQSVNPTNVYIDFLKGLKRQEGLVKAYSIVTKARTHKRWETVGQRYVDVSDATGGQSADIHQDFYTTLRDFGGTIVDLLDTFPLSGIPVNADIEITMNGNAMPMGWSYDSTSRVVRFDQNAIPSEGSIVIAYYQKCVAP
jgi:hypothetical protein